MPRAKDEQYLDVCKHCIAYLSDKHANEKGLFRSSVSQTDVRALQAQIIQIAGSTFREEPDPHLVAEVLQTTFKNLQFPLLHEVYNDIVETDLDDEDFDISESAIQKWMVKLPEAKFFIASSLFQLLAQLASLDESDSNLIQLAYCISPTICRPVTSAYMSIRHMEDLRKIRPVLSFVIENYEEIFVEGLLPNSEMSFRDSSSKLPGQIYGFGSFSDIKAVNSADEGEISAMMSTSMVIDCGGSVASMDENSSVSSGGNTNSSNNINNNSSSSNNNSNIISNRGSSGSPQQQQQQQKPHLRVNIALVNASNAADGAVAAAEVDPLQQFTDGEWTVLEALITARATAFLDFDERTSDMTMMSSRSNSFQSRSNSLDTDGPSTPNSAMHSRSHNFSSPTLSQKDGSSSSGPLSPGGHGHINNSNSGSGPHSPVNSNSSPSAAPKIVLKNRRRRMVADCKALRAQIFEFEQEWTKKHSRVPKNFERGAMESVYTRYRKLKKEIRDLAAIDMQRLARGFVVRSRLGRITQKRPRKLLMQQPSSSSLAVASTAAGTSTAAASDKDTGSGGGSRSSSSTAAVASISVNSRSKAATTATTSGNNSSSAVAVASTSTVTTAAAATSNSPLATDLYSQYRQLLVQKRDLKRELKKFDEDFLEKNGRAPRKSDKEVIRPMYQTYHELKSKLDDLRATIESSHGPLPEDLQEDSRETTTRSSLGGGMSQLSVSSMSNSGHDLLQHPSFNSSSNSSGGGDGSGSSGLNRSMALSPDRQPLKSRSSKLIAAGAAVIGDVSEDESNFGEMDTRMRTSSDGDIRSLSSSSDFASSLLSRAGPNAATATSAAAIAAAAGPSGVAEADDDDDADIASAAVAAAAGQRGSNGSGSVWKNAAAVGSDSLGFNQPTAKVINVEGELEALQVEKRNLHAYLKVYERDFSRLHGRPVTKHADIQPVAHEYQRYKELKALIKDKKNKLGMK